MIVICCNCKKYMGEKEGTGISHGICEDCIKKLYPDLRRKQARIKRIPHERGAEVARVCRAG